MLLSGRPSSWWRGVPHATPLIPGLIIISDKEAWWKSDSDGFNYVVNWPLTKKMKIYLRNDQECSLFGHDHHHHHKHSMRWESVRNDSIGSIAKIFFLLSYSPSSSLSHGWTTVAATVQSGASAAPQWIFCLIQTMTKTSLLNHYICHHIHFHLHFTIFLFIITIMLPSELWLVLKCQQAK